MNNQDIPKLLSYGSIVQIKDNRKKYEDILFYVNHISNRQLSLISNQGLNEIVFNIDEEGHLTDDTIEEIIVLFQPNEGYCKLNNLIVGKYIKILFINNEEVIGKIINQEEDMITIETMDSEKEYIYIDFEYSGLSPELNIKQIVLVRKENIENNINNIQELDDISEVNAADVLIYNMDQQIDDYIEKMFKYKINKHKIQNEIYKYLQLIDKYTNLEQGKKKVQLSNNQVLYSFLHFNKHFITPVTSYIFKDVYSTENEIQAETSNFDQLQSLFESNTDSDYSVHIHNPNDIFKEMEEDNEKDFLDNLIYYYQKKNPFHKKIKILEDTKALLINHNDESENIYSTVISNKELVDNSIYFQNIEKKKSFIINGFFINKLKHIQKQIYLQESETLLSKTIQSNYMNQSRDPFQYNIIRTDIDYAKKNKILENKYLYYPIEKKVKNMKEFISNMNYNLKSIYTDLFENNELNIYSVLKKISILDIYELTEEEISFVNKRIKENVEKLKQHIILTKKELLKVKPSVYTFVTKSEIYDFIIRQYNIKDHEQLQDYEIFEQSYVDSCNLLMFLLKERNKELTLEIDTLKSDDLFVQIENNVEELKKQNLNNNTIHIVKTYNTEKDMYNDTNKIVLKDVEGMSGVQYLHNHLFANFQYTESIELFVEKLNIILQEHKPENTNEVKLNELRKKLFSELGNETSKDIFFNLIQEIINIRVRKNEKCKVLKNDNIYVYNGFSWELFDKTKEKVKKRKILKIKNSIEEFTELKENILNDYVNDMIEQIKNEELIKEEQKEHYDHTLYIQKLKYDYKTIQYNRKILVEKHSDLCIGFENDFVRSDYLSNITNSKYLPLFYKILEIEDLNQKYTLIQKFINLFTIDNNDPDWFYCIISQTKLVPKFLHTLSMSYLTYEDYDETIKQICLNEGTLSDNGDCWIHSKSGYIIQNIDFDTNYGFDENGFKIKLDDVPEEEVFEEEKIANEIEVVIQNKENETEIIKEIILNRSEKEIQHTTLSLMKIIGITFKNTENNNALFKEINHIYENALKDKEENLLYLDKTKLYSILGFLLSYVQCNDIYIKKTYPGCNTTFDGFPLNPNENKDGIIYLSCILEKISKKNPNRPYVECSKLNKDIISSELYEFIQTYTIKNVFITNLLQKKRILRLKEYSGIKNELEYKEIIQNPENFKPSLYELDVIDIESFRKKELGKDITFKHYVNNKDYMTLLNMKIEEKIQTLIRVENNLILQNSFKEPYLVNYCCSNSEFLLECITKTKKDKKELYHLLENSKDLQDILNTIYRSILKCGILNMVKSSIENPLDTSIDSMSEKTIYLFMIKYGNFNNSLPIPEYLTSIISEKPAEFYNPKDELEDKIIKLKENDFNYNSTDFQNALYHKHVFENTVTTKENSETVGTINEIYESFIEEFSTLATMGNKIEKLEKMILKSHSTYESFVTSNISTELTILNKINTIFQNFDSEENADNKQLYISFLFNLNYFLICIIPQYYLYDKIINNKIVCKHWNLAKPHYEDIKQSYHGYYKFFENIELKENDTYKDLFLQIYKYKDLLYYDAFKENPIVYFYYMKYLFYNILFLYSLESEKHSLNSSDFIKRNEFNSALLMFIHYITRTSFFNYDGIKSKVYQIKQSEKKIKTDFLKNMPKKQRDVEKSKMALKLGDWSYGNDQRVYKYYKQLFEKEKEIAVEIKETMELMFGNDKSEILDFEQQNDEENGEIYDNEIDDPRFLLNDDGEYVDDMEPEDEY